MKFRRVVPVALAACIEAHGSQFAPVLTLDESSASAAKLRIEFAAAEPVVRWSGAQGGPPYKVSLSWPVATAANIPDPLPQGGKLVQAAKFVRSGSDTVLELLVAEPVDPWLRTSRGGWELTLAPAHATRPKPPVVDEVRHPGKPSGEPVPLLLDMRVNGQPSSVSARAERRGDVVLVSADAWHEARLAPAAPMTMSDGSPAYSVASIHGAEARLDERTLTLDVKVPPSAFVTSEITSDASASPDYSPRATAFVLGYDVSASRDAGASSGGALLEGSASGAFGTVVNTALAKHDKLGTSASRLDTWWRFDVPASAQSFIVGDAVGSSGAWSRPVRFGGVRWARDYSMRPGFVTMPQVSLGAAAALPSTVDVIVNNVTRLQQPVEPGLFRVPSIPVVTGAGDVELVVRDLLGRETVVRQSYYSSPRLLAPGLDDFAIDAGWTRTGYADDSHYGAPFAAGMYRLGLTDKVTAEGRIEVQRQRQAAGFDVATVIDNWASAHASVAVSSGDTLDEHSAQRHGAMIVVGAERSTRTGGASLQYLRATSGFAPFGEATDALAAGRRVREQIQAAASAQLPGLMTLGLSLTRQARFDGESVNAASASLAMPLAWGASMHMGISRRLGPSGAWSSALYVDIPLDAGVRAGLRTEREPGGGLLAMASAARAPVNDEGLGWRVEAGTQEGARARGGVQYLAPNSEWTLDVAADSRSGVAARGNVRGSAGFVDGVAFASRPLGETGMALVKVGDLPGVPVSRSSRVVATTGADGTAVLTGLAPWQANMIEIDATDLPLDIEFGDVSKQARPYARGAVNLQFEARRTQQMLVILQDAQGRPVPAGARVTVSALDREFVVGKRGEAWLTGLAQGAQTLSVAWGQGQCSLSLDAQAPTTDGRPATVGPLTCR